jgi:polyphosphate kinase 2 (PPK2 family)
VRVHNLVSKQVWSRRYDQINQFEAMLRENNVKILKFFLHISKDEQKKRFLKRIHDPNRAWKVSEDDFTERKYWDDYTAAYEDAVTRCNTREAPWYIIPANKKWFRNLAVSHIIAEELEKMHLKFPAPAINWKKFKWH